MKRMLSWTLALGTACMGAVGLLLRRWQVDTAFETATGLLTPGKPATYALAAVVVIAAAAALALAWAVFRGESPRGYLANLASPHMAVSVLTLLAGALLFAGGALGVRDYALHMDERVIRLVLGLCLMPGGICVGLIGLLGQQRKEAKGRFSGVLLAPGYCACVWLVAAYQGHTANPNIMEYVFLLLGIVCAIFGSYAAASFSFEKPRPVMCAFFSAMGVVLLMVSAADRPWGMDALAIWGFVAYLYVQLVCLICCRTHPPQLEAWVEPEKPIEEDGETADAALGLVDRFLRDLQETPDKETEDQPRGEEHE